MIELKDDQIDIELKVNYMGKEIGVIASSFKFLTGNAPVNQNIIDVVIGFRNDQYTDQPIMITGIANPLAQITSWRYEVRDSKTQQLVALSFNQNPVFNITTTGFYDLKVYTNNPVDFLPKVYEHAFYVYKPRFTREQADIIHNFANGSYFQDFANADNGGLKIWVEGNGTANFQPYRLKGSNASNPVEIQVDPVGGATCTTPNGIAHSWWLNGDTSYVRINGFKNDGTNGLRIQSVTSNTVQVFMVSGGNFTDIHVGGCDFDMDRTIPTGAAAIAFIPNISAASNASVHLVKNLHVYCCKVFKAKDEGLYMMYNNDNLSGGYRAPKAIDSVVARCQFLTCGRDSIQLGACINARVFNNYMDGAGLNQVASQESSISHNGGCAGCIYAKNFCINAKMFINIQSGNCPYNVFAGETDPQGSTWISNVFINGVYPADGPNESWAIYIQTWPDTGTAPLNHRIINNTFICDKKLAQSYGHANSFASTKFIFANNNIVKVGTDGGSYNEISFIGPTAGSFTGSIINNMIREAGDESQFKFTNLATNDLTLLDFTSISYEGTPMDVATEAPDLIDYLTDLSAFPLKAPGQNYTYGAYSGYNKRLVLPPTGDPTPGTFTQPVTIDTITEASARLKYECDKIGVLFYIISTTDVTPSVDQIIAGKQANGTTAPFFGDLIDIGTVSPKILIDLLQNTNYYLFAAFQTIDGVKQTSVTRVAFQTLPDLIAPTLSNFRINADNPNRIYFESSEKITGTTYSNIIIAGKTITSMLITANKTGHYWQVGTNFVNGELPLVTYSGTGSNIIDLAGNALATFSQSVVANGIAPEPAQAVIWIDTSNVTVGGSGLTTSDLTATATSNSGGKSQQIIPADSNGRISWEQTDESRGDGLQACIGLLDDAITFIKIPASILVAPSVHTSNANTDLYKNDMYKATVSAINNPPPPARILSFFIDRVTSFVHFESSIDDGITWTRHYTFKDTGGVNEPIGVGQFRMGATFSVIGKGIRNPKIQAYRGLI
jgi:hypothetical protein